MTYNDIEQLNPHEQTILKSLYDEMQQLIKRMTSITTTAEEDSQYIYFNGDFLMQIISGDTLPVKRIKIKKPPYKLGHYDEYFAFRVDKPGVRHIGKHWGQFTWFESDPSCFVHIRNGDKEFSKKEKSYEFPR